MAFVNPNILQSGISRKEFEELKNRVDLIDSKLDKITSSSENINDNLEETIINSSGELNKNSSVYEVRNDITVHNAKLNGIPRIEYFSFNKKEKTDEVVSASEEANIDLGVINLSDVLNNEKENKTYTYKTENVPVTARTLSGHRTTLMSENKLSNLKNRYYGDAKKIAA